jgi:hypothetical protein
VISTELLYHERQVRKPIAALSSRQATKPGLERTARAHDSRPPGVAEVVGEGGDHRIAVRAVLGSQRADGDLAHGRPPGRRSLGAAASISCESSMAISHCS